MTKRLYRSTKDRMISGVCGGIAEYLNIDPTLVRIGFVALSFLTFFTLIIGYFLCVILIPEEDGVNTNASSRDSNGEPVEKKYRDDSPFNDHRNRQLLGVGLICIGAFIFLRRFVWWFDTNMLWSIAIIGVGLALVIMGTKKKNL